MSKVYFVIKKLPLCNNMSIKVILNYCVADSFAVVKHQLKTTERTKKLEIREANGVI